MALGWGEPSSEPRRDLLVGWLDAHTNFETAMPSRTTAPTLERMEALCDILGDPQLACPTIHITGTNGKGSTARMVTELLVAKGLSVGTYTSPDLMAVNERLSRNAVPIEDEELTEVLASLRQIEPLLPARPTRFELLTAGAFRWFADSAVDVAVVEVGLGGRWDATNVVRPEVAVLTNISYDHTEVLGESLVEIATEKAGIFKPGSVAVIGETDPELSVVLEQEATARESRDVRLAGRDFCCESNCMALGGRILDVRTAESRHADLYLSLHGAHQGANAACALSAAQAFFGAPIDPELARAALSTIRVPGRLEVAGRSPLVLLDGAHNLAGIRALVASVQEEFSTSGDTYCVLGMLQGRDPAAIVRSLVELRPKAILATTAPSPRALPAGEIAAAATASRIEARVAGDVATAMAMGEDMVGADGMLLVTGSLYVVGSARARLVAQGRLVDDSASHR